MSASLDHDPRNLYRRISCAAAELRADDGTSRSLANALARVVDDMRHSGFTGFADALNELVVAAREAEDDRGEDDEDTDAHEAIEKLERVLGRAA